MMRTTIAGPPPPTITTTTTTYCCCQPNSEVREQDEAAKGRHTDVNESRGLNGDSNSSSRSKKKLKLSLRILGIPQTAVLHNFEFRVGFAAKCLRSCRVSYRLCLMLLLPCCTASEIEAVFNVPWHRFVVIMQ